MGLLDLFKKDAGKELERAVGYLRDGNPQRALDNARRFIQDKDQAHRSRAQQIVQQAREALVVKTLERSAEAEAAGDPADAADWVRAALQHVDDEDRRRKLEERMETLERAAEQQKWAEPPPPPVLDGDRDDATDEPVFGLDLDSHYETLVGTLDSGVGEHYEDRPAEFRQAYVDLNEGRYEEAAEVLERLAEAAPDDPVLRFERGRVRMAREDHAGAREDFEAAWPAFGDDPVDLAESMTLPGLWAEAALADGDPQAVIDRLEEPAAPRRNNADLTSLYAQALVAAERWDDARAFLVPAGEAFPKRQDLSFMLGRVLHQVGERQLAVQCLERSIAPSCASGSCSRPPLHLPSLRLLAGLHLQEVEARLGTEGAERAVEKSLDRAEDLLRWIRGAQGGQLAPGDRLLLARYYEAKGDREAAEETRAEAQRLAEAGYEPQAATAGQAPALGGGKRSVL